MAIPHHLRVEVVAIPVSGTHTHTLCECSEIPTTSLTPFLGMSEMWEYPPGVEKRFSTAEDTKRDPNIVEGMADTGTVDAQITWSVFVRAFLMYVVCSLIVLLLLLKAWEKEMKE